MRTATRRGLAGIAGLALFLVGGPWEAAGPSIPAASAESARHQILLQRPFKVGEVVREAVTVRKLQRSVMKAGTKTKRQTEDRTVELVAKVLVLAVDGMGRPTKSQYLVERFVSREGQGQPQDVLAPGRVLTITRGDPPVIALDRGVLDEQTQRDVRAVISTRALKSFSDDQVFGTTTPQPVGGSWPLNTELAAKGLSDDTISIRPSGLSGGAKLVALRREGGVECLEVQGSFRAKGLQMHKLPPSATVERSDLRMEVTSLLPTDRTKHAIRQRSHNKADFRLKMKAGREQVTMDMHMEETKESWRAPLPH